MHAAAAPSALNTLKSPGMLIFIFMLPSGVRIANCAPAVVISMSLAKKSAFSLMPNVVSGISSPSVMPAKCGSSAFTTARLDCKNSFFFAAR